MEDDSYSIAAKLITDADAILVMSITLLRVFFFFFFFFFFGGAGMGVDSGLGTFRGKSAKKIPVLEGTGLDFADASDPQWFDDEEKAHFGWSFWKYRYDCYTKNKPHKGYDIIKSWGEKKKKYPMYSYTSNIDGHWIECGVPQERCCEMHGSVRYLQCYLGEKCKINGDKVRDAKDVMKNIKFDKTGKKLTSPLPRCDCGQLLRPNVLMFCDMAQIDPRWDLPSKNYYKWLDTIHKENAKLCIIEIGCGLAIPDVRNCGEMEVARDINTSLIRINLEDFGFETEYLSAKQIQEQTVSLGGVGALEALLKLDKLVDMK